MMPSGGRRSAPVSMPDCEHIAGPPPTDVVVPEVVLTIAAGRPVRAVWENELGGLTFEVGAGDGRVFVKWSPGGDAPDLTVEAERLDWAARHTAVPRVLDVGREHGGSWMVTSALSGASAVAPEWIAPPEIAVTGLGRGLRALHDALPVDDCPFSWSVDERIVRAAAVVERDAPPDDRLVVCHGDACAPNTVLDVDGTCVGHVDLGRLGVADRWADLAVATWSTEWNYGPGWEGLLLDAYGVEPDPERTDFSRWLWDLAS
jgi:kanamycin kinase